MKVLGIIPARGGSKGLPRKNIKKLAEKPLIAYSIESAIHSNLTDVIVSTDDTEIKQVSESLGALVPFLRSEVLSNDTAKSIEVAMHALKFMEEYNNFIYDAIMLLQPTAPFRTSEDINRCLEIIAQYDDADSVISVVDVEAHHPARMKFVENGILIDPPFCEKHENQNRQELTPMFIRNGSIYLTRRNTILNGSFKGKKSMAYIMPAVRSANIDTLNDFEHAEWIYNRFLR
jgi:CMP-N,N'-diacetyllegionaminic acid synthase